MTPPTLTIGVTYHDEGPLLSDCLASIPWDATIPIDVILFDDASTVPPEPFIPAGIPVSILRSPSVIGPASARNRILKASQSDFIHFHDSDDLFDPSWSRSIADAIENDVDVVITDARACDLTGQQLAPGLLGVRADDDVAALLRVGILGAYLPAMTTFRRHLARSIGGFDETLWQSEDYDFHLRLINATDRCLVIPQALATVRIRKEGRSRRALREVYAAHLQAIQKLTSTLPRSHHRYLATAAATTAWKAAELGDFHTASTAVYVARRIDPAARIGTSPLQRMVTRVIPLRLCLTISRTYHRLVPANIRSVVQQCLADPRADSATLTR